MAITVFALLAALAAQGADFPAVERSTDAVIVVYPAENAVLPPTANEFIYGSVSDPKGRFEINGAAVAVHPKGGYLAWLPVASGTFTFNCLLTLKDGTTTSTQRAVFVTPPPAPLPEKPLAIDPESIWPKEDLELRPGDHLVARMRASPSRKARFRPPRRPWQPMREAEASLGIYEGAYLVEPAQDMSPAPVEFELGSGWSAARAKSRGKVSLDSGAAPVAVVKAPGSVMIKTGPGEGDVFPVLPGARLLSAGRQGTDVKVRLSDALSGWIEARHLEFLPPGTAPPRAVTETVTAKSSGDSTFVRISLDDRVPFSVDESEDLRSVTVRLYYANTHTNWIVYDSADALVDEVRLKQEGSGVLAVAIRLKPGRTLWGHHASYDGTALKLELRGAPALARAPASPLKGLAVFLDPGHMPSAPGAIGALGTREMDVNYAVAEAVASRLKAEGALPIVSRSSASDEVSLADRPRLAWENKAELFVSLHNNNLAGGTNPFAYPRGFSVFYYHPHSLALAREVYRAYEKGVPLPGEDLRYGNLLVARMTQMPAILVESAYMSFPEQEEKLLDPKFRETLAEALVNGLRSFLAAERAKQAGVPARAVPAAVPSMTPKALPKGRQDRAAPAAQPKAGQASSAPAAVKRRPAPGRKGRTKR